MQTKAKSNSTITHEVTADAIAFHVKDAGTVRLELGKLSEAVRQRAMLHGMVQRISDAAAISRDPATGRPASAAEKLAAMEALVQHYETGTGEWARARAATGFGAAGVLLSALREAYPEKDAGALREWLGTRTGAERAALRASTRLKPIIERLEAASAGGVDAEELLSGLES